MNRRQFLGGMIAGAAGLLLPDPERRVWALDRTMIRPAREQVIPVGFQPRAVIIHPTPEMRTEVRWREVDSDEWQTAVYIERDGKITSLGRVVSIEMPFTFSPYDAPEPGWSGPRVNGELVRDLYLDRKLTFPPLSPAFREAQ